MSNSGALQSDWVIWKRDPQLPPDEPERWAPVAGYEGLYEVSTYGNVKSIRAGRIMSKHLSGTGYPKAEVSKNGQRYQTTIHRLVAEAFIPNPLNKPEVNHIDGDRTNNMVSNLEWVTRAENEHHSRYVLGNLIRPVFAIAPGAEVGEFYASIEAAARVEGHASQGIYQAIERGWRHAGKYWAYAAPDPSSGANMRDALKNIISLLPNPTLPITRAIKGIAVRGVSSTSPIPATGGEKE